MKISRRCSPCLVPTWTNCRSFVLTVCSSRNRLWLAMRREFAGKNLSKNNNNWQQAYLWKRRCTIAIRKLHALANELLMISNSYSWFHITFPRCVAKSVGKLGTRLRSSQLSGELDNQIANFELKFPTSAALNFVRLLAREQSRVVISFLDGKYLVLQQTIRKNWVFWFRIVRRN